MVSNCNLYEYQADYLLGEHKLRGGALPSVMSRNKPQCKSAVMQNFSVP